MAKLVLCIALTLLLAACGVKGDLKRPAPSHQASTELPVDGPLFLS